MIFTAICGVTLNSGLAVAEETLFEQIAHMANAQVALDKPTLGRSFSFGGTTTETNLKGVIRNGDRCALTLNPILGDTQNWLNALVAGGQKAGVQARHTFTVPKSVTFETGWDRQAQVFTITQYAQARIDNTWNPFSRKRYARITYTLKIGMNESLSAVKFYRYRYELEGNRTIHKYDTSFPSPFFYTCTMD
jgi:hypothetical protein